MMKKIKFTLWIMLAIFAVVATGFAFDRDGFWMQIVGNPDLGQTNFTTLVQSAKPNEGLVCPKGYCPNRKPDQISPVYALSTEKLKSVLTNKLKALPLVIRVDENASPSKLRYVARTPIMRYPDTMSIDFISLEENRSTLAIHAKAQVGKSDFGNNLIRINAWLDMIREFEEK